MANPPAATVNQVTPPPGPSKGPLLIALINLLILLAAAGLLYYTHFIFKRPAITEHAERERLEKIAASPVPPPSSMLIGFDPITVNIASMPGKPAPANGTTSQIQGKLHYANVGFALEISDSNRSNEIEELKPILIDKVISILGHKTFQELSSAQGRYLLRSEILNFTNDFISKHQAKKTAQQESAASLITGVYFTQFTVQ